MTTIIVSLVIIALLIADVFFVEYENFGWTTVSILATSALLYFTKAWGVADWVMANAKTSVVIVAAYLVVGVVWSFIKWFSYLISYRDKFLNIKNNLVSAREDLIESQYTWAVNNLITINNNPLTKKDLPLDQYVNYSLLDQYRIDTSKIDNGKIKHDNYIKYKELYCDFKKPIATNNKGKIVAWICYWPWSLIGTVINDPLRRLVDFIFRSLKELYQKMSDKIFKDFPDKNSF